jgi:hypothetical protein
MTSFATVLSPFSFGPAIQLGNSARWRKKVLPIGDIEYQGRTLHFTPGYIAGLERAFRDGAYDQVSFQLADSANSHTNDPERHRGTIVDMKAEPDGLWITVEPTERGGRVLQENPYLGVSARIVEQYQRSDGRFYPAAIQHILGTLDPRIPGLGAWQPVSLSNSSAVTIDLSAARWPGEQLPAVNLASDDIDWSALSDQEMSDLIEAMYDADTELDALPGEDPAADPELEALMQHADADYQPADFSDFNDAFAVHAQADAARAATLAELDLLDVVSPVRRDEDRMQRILARLDAGGYDGRQLSFAAESAAVELAVTTGRGTCGVPDEFGRCSARYHDLECQHGLNADWLASGPHPQTFANSLSRWSAAVELASQPGTVFGDPDADEPGGVIPRSTLELAHQLSHDWGLDVDAPFPDAAANGLGDISMLRGPSYPVTPYDEMAESIGYGGPPPQALTRPGISQLARDLGLK